MRCWARVFSALAMALSLSAPAFAQGGGASSTGTIQGRVADAQGAVLPGVTVTATSPALIQPQTTVTSETGNYRFPAVPPGTYELTFELAGFNTLKRSGISLDRDVIFLAEAGDEGTTRVGIQFMVNRHFDEIDRSGGLPDVIEEAPRGRF